MFGLCEETGIIGAFCTLIVPYRVTPKELSLKNTAQKS